MDKFGNTQVSGQCIFCERHHKYVGFVGEKAVLGSASTQTVVITVGSDQRFCKSLYLGGAEQ